MTQPSDIAIIGGGIVGLATAIALIDRYPRARLVILDKESKIAHELRLPLVPVEPATEQVVLGAARSAGLQLEAPAPARG